jgi:hypothetical protein
MYLDSKNTVKLSELIHWVKKELLSDEARQRDPVPLFVIDEVTVEVNFVLSGEGEGVFDLKVVKAGAKVTEERVQKAIIRMKPLVSPEELSAEFARKQPKAKKKVLNDSVEVLLKGRTLDDDTIEERE